MSISTQPRKGITSTCLRPISRPIGSPCTSLSFRRAQRPTPPYARCREAFYILEGSGTVEVAASATRSRQRGDRRRCAQAPRHLQHGLLTMRYLVIVAKG